MKTIWFGNEKFEKMVANAGIDLICNEHMEITIADEDVAKVAEILGDDNSMYWGVDEDEQETKKTYLLRSCNGEEICKCNTLEDVREELINSPASYAGLDEEIDDNPDKDAYDIAYDYVGFYDICVVVDGEIIGFYNRSQSCATLHILDDLDEIEKIANEYMAKVIDYIENKK